jgi:protein-tyrosine phosphatase
MTIGSQTDISQPEAGFLQSEGEETGGAQAMAGPANPSVISEVNESIYIGSLLSVKELTHVASKHASWLVVSAIHSTPMRNLVLEQLRSLRELRPDLAIRHVDYKLRDQVNEALVSRQLERVLEHMDEYILNESSAAGGTTRACLVHCAMGISRSASVITAWFMTRRHLSLEKAVELIRRARPTVQPNVGFIAGLRAIEQSQSIDDAIQRLEGRRHQSKTEAK